MQHHPLAELRLGDTKYEEDLVTFPETASHFVNAHKLRVSVIASVRQQESISQLMKFRAYSPERQGPTEL